MDPANDVPRPLTPLVFLCAAIRAELEDMRRKCDAFPVYSPAVSERLDRIETLAAEIERHAEEP
jgi:hypothetical protein